MSEPTRVYIDDYTSATVHWDSDGEPLSVTETRTIWTKRGAPNAMLSERVRRIVEDARARTCDVAETGAKPAGIETPEEYRKRSTAFGNKQPPHDPIVGEIASASTLRVGQAVGLVTDPRRASAKIIALWPVEVEDDVQIEIAWDLSVLERLTWASRLVWSGERWEIVVPGI